MNRILISIIAGSIVASGHDTREACEGRAVILREQKVLAKCVEAPSSTLRFTTTSPYVTLPPDGVVIQPGILLR